jgi:hypothetical protein
MLSSDGSPPLVACVVALRWMCCCASRSHRRHRQFSSRGQPSAGAAACVSPVLARCRGGVYTRQARGRRGSCVERWATDKIWVALKRGYMERATDQHVDDTRQQCTFMCDGCKDNGEGGDCYGTNANSTYCKKNCNPACAHCDKCAECPAKCENCKSDLCTSQECSLKNQIAVHCGNGNQCVTLTSPQLCCWQLRVLGVQHAGVRFSGRPSSTQRTRRSHTYAPAADSAGFCHPKFIYKSFISFMYKYTLGCWTAPAPSVVLACGRCGMRLGARAHSRRLGCEGGRLRCQR